MDVDALIGHLINWLPSALTLLSVVISLWATWLMAYIAFSPKVSTFGVSEADNKTGLRFFNLAFDEQIHEIKLQRISKNIEFVGWKLHDPDAYSDAIIPCNCKEEFFAKINALKGNLFRIYFRTTGGYLQSEAAHLSLTKDNFSSNRSFCRRLIAMTAKISPMLVNIDPRVKKIVVNLQSSIVAKQALAK